MIRYEFVRDSMDKFFFQQLSSSRLVRLAPLAIMVNIFMLFDAIADGNRSFFAPSNSIYSWSFCMFKISFVNVPVQVLTASHCFWCNPSQGLVDNEICVNFCGVRVAYQFQVPEYTDWFYENDLLWHRHIPSLSRALFYQWNQRQLQNR